MGNPIDSSSIFIDDLTDYGTLTHNNTKIYDMVMDRWNSTGYSPTDDINTAYGNERMSVYLFLPNNLQM